MPFIDGAKRALHRGIVADPVLHGRVLNLYLNGEAYPQRVEDYFPLALVRSPALEARMRLHLKEEAKHVALYASAVRKLGQPVRELPREEIYNAVIQRHVARRGKVEARANEDAGTLALAGFLAHLHWLETRIGRSLEYHVEACDALSPHAAKVVAAVLRDEHGHVEYTREAVHDLLPAHRAKELLAHHRRAEAAANREFSARELARLVHEHRERFRPPVRWFWRGCAALMNPGGAHG